MKQPENMGKDKIAVVWSATAKVPKVSIIDIQKLSNDWGEDVIFKDDQLYFFPKRNLVVDNGIQRSLDKLVGINGPPNNIITIGIDDGTGDPVAGTSNSTAGSTNRRLVSFDSTPTRTGNVLSIDGTFTESNVLFIMKRLFLSAASAGTSDSAGDLYSMTNVFTIDFTSFATWSLTFTATITGVGS